MPACPVCQNDAFTHRFYSVGDKRNGWYCDRCDAGGFRLGTMDDAENQVNTEAQAASFAIKLLNKSFKR